MRVHVDRDVCQGHTLCSLAAPGLLQIGDEDGLAYVEDEEVPPGMEDNARMAARTCPEGAISVTE